MSVEPIARPLRQRPLDIGLIVIFSLFAFTSLCVDMLNALDVDFANSTNPLIQSTYEYGLTVDPLLIQNPLWLQLMTAVSAFVMGPFYLVLIYALAKGRDWIRLPSIVYASAILYSMIVYFGVELLGDVRPLNYAKFFGFTLPYVFAPLVLMVRMWRPDPFGAGNPPN